MGWTGLVRNRFDPQFIPRRPVLWLAFSGEHQNRDQGCFGATAQEACHFVAVQFRHHHIQDDQVGKLFLGQFERLCSIHCMQCFVAQASDKQTEIFYRICIIVND